MRILLLGGTGHTGRAVIDCALERGHTVTAPVRIPEKLGPRDGLKVVRGDVCSREALRELLAPHDVVISTLGHSGLGAESILTDSARALTRAMNDGGVWRRLIIVSVGALFEHAGFVAALLRHTLLRNVVRDSAEMERVVKQSWVEWTIVRPPRLTHAASSGGYRLAVDGLPPGFGSLSRQDLARFLVDEAEHPAQVRHLVGLAAALPAERPVSQHHATAH